MPVGFIPEQDKGYLVVNCQLPDGASLQRTEPVVERLAQEALDTPGVAHVISVAGYSLDHEHEPAQRRRDVRAARALRRPGGRSRASRPARSPGGCGGPSPTCRRRRWSVFPAPPVEGMGNTGGFKLAGAATGPPPARRPSRQAVESLAEAAAAQPGLAGITTTFRANQPQVFVEVDRAKAQAQGVPIAAVNRGPAALSRQRLRQRLHRLRPQLAGDGAGRRPLPDAAATTSAG